MGTMTNPNDCPTYNEQEMSNDISDMLRSEIKKCIQNLDSRIENYVKKVELPEAINECIKEKLPLLDCPVAKTVVPKTLPVSDHEEVEVTVEFTDSNSHSQQLPLSEAFALMERRISFLESRIGGLLHMKGFRNVSNKVKIDKETSEEERNFEQRLALGENGDSALEEKVKKPVTKPKPEFNPYDDLYYEWRQKKMNELHYKNFKDDFRQNHMPEIEENIRPSINRNCFVQFIKSQSVLD